MITSFRVKDGSGALYCFVPQGKTIKAGTNSLTHSGEEERRNKRKGHAQNKQKPLIFRLRMGWNSTVKVRD
jgi:hypothetical protein